MDNQRELDLEWVELIKEALMEGITADEIKNFLRTRREGTDHKFGQLSKNKSIAR